MLNKISKLATAAGSFAVATMAATSAVAAQSSSSSDAGFGIVMLCVYACCGLIGLAICGGIAYWVYNDATSKNIDNAVLWALLSFFVFPWGILIYFLVARNKAK